MVRRVSQLLECNLPHAGPYFWLGIIAMFNAAFCYYLPEPLNSDLPNSIDDTIFMDQSKPKWFPFRKKDNIVKVYKSSGFREKRILA